jgi:hypothetical protein
MSFLSSLFKSKEIIPSNEFEFQLNNPEILEIQLCNVKDYVGLWKHPEKEEIRVYRTGTHSGEGLLGFVPKKFVNPISEHLSIEGEIKTEIRTIITNNLLICCRLIPLEETKRQREISEKEKTESITRLIQKPFVPKKPFEIRIRNDYETLIPKKIQLKLIFKPIEYYIENPDKISIELKSVDNQYSFEQNTGIDEIVRLIRCYYSGYDLKVKIKYTQSSSFDIIITPEK